MTKEELDETFAPYGLRVVARHADGGLTLEGPSESIDRLRADVEQHRLDTLKWKKRLRMATWFRNVAIAFFIAQLIHTLWVRR